MVETLVMYIMEVTFAIVAEHHKPTRRNFKTRQVMLKGVNGLSPADLVEMIPYAKRNQCFIYILIMINCLMKLAIALPLKYSPQREVYL